jgi:hypothetical protein
VGLIEEGQVLRLGKVLRAHHVCRGCPTAPRGWLDLTLLSISNQIQNSLKNRANVSFLAMKGSLLYSVAHRLQILCAFAMAHVPHRWADGAATARVGIALAHSRQWHHE